MQGYAMGGHEGRTISRDMFEEHVGRYGGAVTWMG